MQIEHILKTQWRGRFALASPSRLIGITIERLGPSIDEMVCNPELEWPDPEKRIRTLWEWPIQDLIENNLPKAKLLEWQINYLSGEPIVGRGRHLTQIGLNHREAMHFKLEGPITKERFPLSCMIRPELEGQDAQVLFNNNQWWTSDIPFFFSYWFQGNPLVRSDADIPPNVYYGTLDALLSPQTQETSRNWLQREKGMKGRRLKRAYSDAYGQFNYEEAKAKLSRQLLDILNERIGKTWRPVYQGSARPLDYYVNKFLSEYKWWVDYVKRHPETTERSRKILEGEDVPRLRLPSTEYRRDIPEEATDNQDPEKILEKTQLDKMADRLQIQINRHGLIQKAREASPYGKALMENALERHRITPNYREVEKVLKVPKSTLHDHWKEKIVPKIKHDLDEFYQEHFKDASSPTKRLVKRNGVWQQIEISK